MKTAIVYYSLQGNIRYVAEKVASETGADLIELVTFKKKPELQPYQFKASDYDLVILATPVWASGFTPPLRTFLEDNDLTGKKIAVITTSAGGDSTKCIAALKEAAKADSLVAQLSLVDPKDKPSEEKDQMIAGFVETVKGL